MVRVEFFKPSVLVPGETASCKVTMKVLDGPVRNVKAIDLRVYFSEWCGVGYAGFLEYYSNSGEFLKQDLDRWITEDGVILPGEYEHEFNFLVPQDCYPTCKVSGNGYAALNMVQASLAIRKKGWWRRDKRFNEPLDVTDLAAPKDNGPPAIEDLEPYVQRKAWFGSRVNARVTGALDGTVKELGDSIQLTVTVANPHPTRNLVLEAPSFKENDIFVPKLLPLRHFSKKLKSPFVLTSVFSGSGEKPLMNPMDKRALIVPASESRTFIFIGNVPMSQQPTIAFSIYTRVHNVTFKVKPTSGFLGFTRNCYSLDYWIPDSRYSFNQ